MANADVFWIFMLDYTKGWGIRPHTHDFYQLYYITSGKGWMKLDGRKLLLSPKACVLIFPGQEHELFKMQSGVLRMIDVKFYVHDGALENELRGIAQTQQLTAEFQKLLADVRAEWKSALPFKKHMADILLEQCLYILIRTHIKAEESKFLFPETQAKTKDMSGLPAKIAAYVEEHCFDDISLDEMARELTYNRNYLCKVFKKASGITIIRYANYLRIAKAVDLICYSTEKISDICESVGFHDIHYFSKVFKQITNHTPGELRSRQQHDMYTDIVEHGRFSYRYYDPD